MDDLLKEFLTETSENIAALDVDIVRFEQTPNDLELLGSIFRLVHTIKGTCGFIRLPRLEHIAHAGENVLGKFRDGILPVTPHAVSLILKSIDTIKELLGYLERNEAEPDGSDEELIAGLNALAADAAPALDKSAVPAGIPSAANDPPSLSIVDQSIRVGVDRLENIMTTVSELVLTRNQLLQILRGQKGSAFQAPLQRLNHVTSELQESVIRTRMQPIGNAWAKAPRIVRDLSQELGKKIDLRITGAETELDRQVLDLIKDPLMHMVRNSADHGIEAPADRVKAGKPETGSIALHAYHEGGHIFIQISDDGGGLPLEKIRNKIRERNLATDAELADMPDRQIMQFVFKPGFSTAARVTAVSGRGVGMDVVKTNIEKIGGTVDFRSEPGKGSCFFIKIPLTLAIVSALIAGCNGEYFAIPQIGIVELVQVSADGGHRVERINDMPVLRLRGRLLPLVCLRKILKLGEDAADSDGRHFIIVVQAGHSIFGVIVDRVFDTEEIVVKPVSPVLRHLDIFCGNTILGDGSVVMILDPNGMMRHAGNVFAKIESAPETADTAKAARNGGRQPLLLFHAGDASPKAVPLSLVARLERFDCSAIEYSNGTPMVQYHGKLMPLVPVTETAVFAKKGMQPVIVFSDRERSMGLAVDDIIDIVDDALQVDLTSRRPGFLGTSVISGKATDIVDAAYYLSRAFRDWFGVETGGTYGAEKTGRVLLVDDSPFFRNLLTPLLKVAGYAVTAVDNAASALKLREAGEDFDVIISDIEMPGMNGFEFAAAVRNGGRWQDAPMIALSAHATGRDVDRGREAGFTDYIPKFNREILLSTVQHNLSRHENRI